MVNQQRRELAIQRCIIIHLDETLIAELTRYEILNWRDPEGESSDFKATKKESMQSTIPKQYKASKLVNTWVTETKDQYKRYLQYSPGRDHSGELYFSDPEIHASPPRHHNDYQDSDDDEEKEYDLFAYTDKKEFELLPEKPASHGFQSYERQEETYKTAKDARSQESSKTDEKQQSVQPAVERRSVQSAVDQKKVVQQKTVEKYFQPSKAENLEREEMVQEERREESFEQEEQEQEGKTTYGKQDYKHIQSRLLQSKIKKAKKLDPQADADKIKRRKERIKRLNETTRDLANSAFMTYFGKPPFENYGKGNVKPAVGGILYGDYLKTHNVNPHRGPSVPRYKQVFDGADFSSSKKPIIQPEPPRNCKEEFRLSPKQVQALKERNPLTPDKFTEQRTSKSVKDIKMT